MPVSFQLGHGDVFLEISRRALRNVLKGLKARRGYPAISPSGISGVWREDAKGDRPIFSSV
jgi:hypothetical protein